MVTLNKQIAMHVAIFCLGIARVSLAQDPLAAVRPYDGIQAGLDAYRLAEDNRRAGVNQQIYLNDQLRFWNGYPTSRGETIYYGYMSPAAMAAYGYGGYGPWTGFQPGPWMGGGLWGGGTPYYYPPARQSIGQQQLQTGPNRWESHPVYDPPVTNYSALPPVDSPLLDRTPYATPPAVTPTVPSPSVPVLSAPSTVHAPAESVPAAPPASVTPAPSGSSLLNKIDSIPPPPPSASPSPAAPSPVPTVPRTPRER